MFKIFKRTVSISTLFLLTLLMFETELQLLHVSGSDSVSL